MYPWKSSWSVQWPQYFIVWKWEDEWTLEKVSKTYTLQAKCVSQVLCTMPSHYAHCLGLRIAENGPLYFFFFFLHRHSMGLPENWRIAEVNPHRCMSSPFSHVLRWNFNPPQVSCKFNYHIAIWWLNLIIFYRATEEQCSIGTRVYLEQAMIKYRHGSLEVIMASSMTSVFFRAKMRRWMDSRKSVKNA